MKILIFVKSLVLVFLFNVKIFHILNFNTCLKLKNNQNQISLFRCHTMLIKHETIESLSSKIFNNSKRCQFLISHRYNIVVNNNINQTKINVKKIMKKEDDSVKKLIDKISFDDTDFINKNKNILRTDIKRPVIKSPINLDLNFIKNGSLKANKAIRYYMSIIKKQNTNLKVLYHDISSHSLVQSNFRDFCHNMDLQFEGIEILKKKSDNNIPIVKKVTVQTMIKNYISDLSLQRENELIQSGNVHFKKILNLRLKKLKKNQTIKTLVLNWKINLNDLNKQKKNDLINRLNRKETFMITFRGKNFLNQNDQQVEPINELERIKKKNYEKNKQHILKQREVVFETVKEIFNDYNCKYTIEGSVEGDCSIKITSIGQDTFKSTETNNITIKEKKKKTKKKEMKILTESELNDLYNEKIGI